jgi:DNA-binding SARP family transcriptional activator
MGYALHNSSSSSAPVEASVEIRLLGRLEVASEERSLDLPASRKVRALLAYLALSPRTVNRSQLCELFWDAPSDPRGELRWCLSKIRTSVNIPILAREESVQLDLSGCSVDALEVSRAADQGIEKLPFETQKRLAALYRGDFLEGLDMDASPLFEGWLTAQRRRFRSIHAALLESLAKCAPQSEAFGYLDKWRELAPFDPRVHQALLAALARSGKIREGEEHLASVTHLFEAEGLDAGSLVSTWKSSREVAKEEQTHRRGSIAVMPFEERAGAARGGTGQAFAHDVITRLAKLRNLFVIAQGTVRALHERGIGAEEAGRILNVDYVVSGSMHHANGRISVAVELSETRSARIVWAETYRQKADDAFAVLEDIGNRIVAAVAAEIETLEKNRAILKPPSSLDAWESYHRGLWHMFRYVRADNLQARHFFQQAVKLDPTFSRAYAGLAFTHFQGAFQGWEERIPQIEQAYHTASDALAADERDPAAHWAMGRAMYLMKRWEDSEAALTRSVDLSPNFALGHYNLSFLRSVVGSPTVAIADADLSRQLSPYDPMLFGMLATKAMSLVRLGKFDQASAWAIKAAARPNSFPHIHAIAAFTLALSGDLTQAQTYVANARRTTPNYSINEFLLTFPFEKDGEALFRKGAKLVGMA